MTTAAKITASKTTIVQLPAAVTTAAGNLIPSSTTIEVPGSYFYVKLTSAAIQIRLPGGSWSSYLTGDHIQVEKENAWQRLEIQNANPNPLAAAIFVGWDTFGTDRLILQSPENPQIIFPKYASSAGLYNAATGLWDASGSAEYVDVVDLSGQLIVDTSGNQWLAIQRVGLIITNETNNWFPIIAYEARANGNEFTSCPTQQITLLPISGSVTIHPGTDNTCKISEIYSVIPLNLLT